MFAVTLDVSLTLKAPVLSRSTASGRYGVDAPVARSAGGHPCLPGTLVKGRLRDAWRELADVSPGRFDARTWLGEGASGGSREPHRGRLWFTDFESPADGLSGSFHRIRIDRRRRAVDQGALQVIEDPFGVGNQVRFVGRIDFLAATPPDRDRAVADVLAGLRWLTSLGAERTVGFGCLIDVSMNMAERAVPAPAASVPCQEILGLSITPKEPLCVGSRQVAGNLFVSGEAIPGGALKGALAETWWWLLGKPGPPVIVPGCDPDRAQLAQHFDRIRFTHAFPTPVNGTTRSTVPPLSLVKDHTGRVADVAFQAGPVLMGPGQRSPKFAIDWKSAGDVDRRHGVIRPSRHLRVRTAIDPGTRRAAEHQLFAYDCVVPWTADGGLLQWLGGVDLHGVPGAERGDVAAQLLSLLSVGLHGLGKTKAIADVAVQMEGPWGPTVPGSPAPKDGCWAIVLQTPALLFDPSSLNESSGATELFGAYKAAWADMSDGSLELVRFFARQSLAGGDYLHARFQPGTPYTPYLLTDPGSVFVLKPVTGDAEKWVKCWSEHGLSVPQAVGERYERGNQSGDHWTNCPYIPENGYGEVIVNPALPEEAQGDGVQ